MKKYNRFLTLLLIILTISLIILVGYAIYTLFDNYIADKSAEELMAEFESDYQDSDELDATEPNEPERIEEQENPVQQQEGNNNIPNKTTQQGGSSSYKLGTYYRDYKVIGIISIPKLKIQYPIFGEDNSTTLKVGTAAIYPGNAEKALNTAENTVIAGHNYRNSRMFSKLYTLESGDSIYITNIYGTKLEYKVYNNYTTSSMDFDYATRNTNGKPEISLTTCTTDASTRTIIWARAE